MMDSSDKNNTRQALISPRNILLFIFISSTFLNIIALLIQINNIETRSFSYSYYLNLFLNALVIAAVIKRWQGVLKVYRIFCIVSLVAVLVITVILVVDLADDGKKITEGPGYGLMFCIYSLALLLIIIYYMGKYIKQISGRTEPEKEESNSFQQTA